MPNPNVDALATILQDCPGFDDAPVQHIGKVAEYLAQRGVLVVSDAVLTDEACERIAAAPGMLIPSNGSKKYTASVGDDGTVMTTAPLTWPQLGNVRRALSRLAKGDLT